MISETTLTMRKTQEKEVLKCVGLFLSIWILFR